MNITNRRNLTARLLRAKASETGIVLVCAWCKRIPHGAGSWIRFEEYFSSVQGIRFSHGICPRCSDTVLLDRSSVPEGRAGGAPAADHA
jgi:hypothetical protein